MPLPTELTLTAPSPAQGDINTASQNFTVSTNGTVVSSTPVTLFAVNGSGVFSPTSVTLSASIQSATFTFTPEQPGVYNIQVIASGLANGNANYTSIDTIVVTGPNPGEIGIDSDYTWSLSSGQNSVSTIDITAEDSPNTGSFDSNPLSISENSNNGGSGYIPGSTGIISFTFTNDSNQINTPFSFTSNPALLGGMASVTDTTETTASLSATNSTEGVTPYNYQWLSGPTPTIGPGWGGVSEATSLTLIDTPVSGNTYFALLYQDSLGGRAISNIVEAIPQSAGEQGIIVGQVPLLLPGVF